ncbi:MAG: co-chaperone GroES family protein [bacterium]|nr:co-chaperone GroES family protein [bacterium]
MSVPITPLRNYVVCIKEEKKELKTKSGILLAPTVSDEDTTLKVVAVGKDVKEIKTGNRVVAKSYSQTEAKLEFGGEQYQLIKDEDILAVVK